MTMTCAKIGNTCINTANITYFISYQAKESRPTELLRDPMPAGNLPESQPATLNINLVDGEKLKFSGPRAEKGFDKLTELMAVPIPTIN